MNKKDNQRIRLTKQLLQNSLVRLLHTKPIYEISVTELCAEAQINRSTFYKYYDTVYDILTEIENSFIVESRHFLTALHDEEPSNILASISLLLDYMKDHSEAAILLLDNDSNMKFSNQLLAFLVESLHNEISIFSMGSIPDSDYIFEYVISGSLAIIKHWLASGAKEKAGHIAQLIYHSSLTIIQNKKTL